MKDVATVQGNFPEINIGDIVHINDDIYEVAARNSHCVTLTVKKPVDKPTKKKSWWETFGKKRKK